MNKVLIFVAAVALLSTAAILIHQKFAQPESIPWSFTSCGNGALTVNSVSLSDTPKRGKTIEFVISGNANAAVSTKHVDFSIKLGGTQLFHQDTNWANNFSAGQAFTFTQSDKISILAPGGTYTLYLNFYDTAGANQACIQSTFKL